MGTVTKFSFRIKTKNLPYIFRNALLGGLIEKEHPDIEHPFFKDDRYEWVLIHNHNGCNRNIACRAKRGCVAVFVENEVYNNSRVIEKFLDWISPYVYGRRKMTYMGWSKSENADNQTHYWRTADKKIISGHTKQEAQ